MLFHESESSMYKYFYDVFGGVSFWFTSSLLVSEIILLTLFLTKIRSVWFYFVVSVFLFCFAYWLSRFDLTPFPWYYKSGIAATLFLTIGGIYQRYEADIDKFISRVGYVLIVIFYWLFIIWDFDKYSMNFGLMSVNINSLGFIESILGIIMIVGLCKKIKNVSFINHIGKNSIVFYFLSGVVPATISTIIMRFVEINYLSVIMIVVLSLVLGSCINYVINKYFKFLLDLRCLIKTKKLIL